LHFDHFTSGRDLKMEDSNRRFIRQPTQDYTSAAAKSVGDGGPMQAFMKSLRGQDLPTNIASDHDSYLAAAYADKHDR
jgi:hypothetical protein